MQFRADNVVTRGTFSLDGQTFEVENNVWVLGDDAEVVVIDAPHDIAPVLEVVGDRRVTAILATHAHDDHVRLAPALADATGAPIRLHPADARVWELTHPDRTPDAPLADGDRIRVGDGVLEVLHTPGHTPGAVSLHAAGSGVVYTGDTLFHGGPGATGRSFSDHDTILASIRQRLFVLPDDTVVHPGHGGSTTVGAERSELQR
ncbi:MBL fold metallo-hydrolase [Pseudonocardia nigra]|uniref:MBL fold metallo-hydrolase n=1 Tax=Pseudonocardia nigra TaxID=1921578 RepID=UPI001C5E1580|nr:MBL fold metallo-hydrolase [Pseudonocardia nigra]